jgi:hypothetical protein
MDRLSPAALDGVLKGLLDQQPPARVVAIGENGLFVPMPATVALHGHVVLEGASSALELVVPEDIVAVIEAWEAARADGAATAVVHPLAIPDLRVELHFVDAVERFGVYLGVVTGVPDAARWRPEPGRTARCARGTA